LVTLVKSNVPSPSLPLIQIINLIIRNEKLTITKNDIKQIQNIIFHTGGLKVGGPRTAVLPVPYRIFERIFGQISVAIYGSRSPVESVVQIPGKRSLCWGVLFFGAPMSVMSLHHFHRDPSKSVTYPKKTLRKKMTKNLKPPKIIQK